LQYEKEREKKKKKACQFSSESGQILLDSGKISPESLLMAFWEIKSKVPELKEIEILGG
jgi:hypothetical protein